MILHLIRGSGLSAWLTEEITGGASRDPTPALDRLRRYQEELAAAVVDHLRGLAVPPKAARKWLQVARGQTDPSAAMVEDACRHLEAFVRGILPQILHDPRELRD
ncbi:MAG TPA: hypothetical protein VIG69_08090 [Candidatus Methylomirabilis sp.]|jgi:hypothetical protein